MNRTLLYLFKLSKDFLNQEDFFLRFLKTIKIEQIPLFTLNKSVSRRIESIIFELQRIKKYIVYEKLMWGLFFKQKLN